MLSSEPASLITEQHTKEFLSRAYLYATAASAGFNVSIREFDYGVDYGVHSVSVNHQRTRRVEDGFSFSLQLKSTVNWEQDGPNVVYDLEAKTWNDMVARDATRPLYLGLLCLAQDPTSWLTCDEQQAVIKHCCYWYDATGQAPTKNQQSIRVRIPRANLMDANGLIHLMAKSRAAVETRR